MPDSTISKHSKLTRGGTAYTLCLVAPEERTAFILRKRCCDEGSIAEEQRLYGEMKTWKR